MFILIPNLFSIVYVNGILPKPKQKKNNKVRNLNFFILNYFFFFFFSNMTIIIIIIIILFLGIPFFIIYFFD